MSEDWKETTLNDIVVSSRIRKMPNELGIDQVVHYSIPAFDETGGALLESVDSIASHKFLVPEDSVLVSLLNPRIPRILKATGGSNAVCSTEFAALRPKGSTIGLDFLHVLCTSADFSNRLQAVAKGTTGSRKRAHLNDLLGFKIALPPLATQRRIVAVIDSIDNQIAALNVEQNAAVAMVRSLRTSLGVGEEYTTLSELACDNGIQIGPFGSQLHAHEYVDDGIPVVMPQDIVNGKVTKTKIKRVSSETALRLKKHRLSTGDIVFPRRGDLSKRALITDDQDGWLCGTGCLRFRARDIDSAQRVFEALSNDTATEWLIGHAVGTTMLNLNTSILHALPVPVFKDEMSALADACRDLATFTSQVDHEASSLRTTRSATLNALLSREIEIPGSFDELLNTKVAV